MYQTVRRVSACALAVGFVLAAVATASADQHRIQSWGIVMSRDLSAGTLGIDDRVYRVTSQTRFRDVDGAVIAFDGFAVFDVHAGVFALSDATKVEYVARRTRAGWVLESVQLVDELPH